MEENENLDDMINNLENELLGKDNVSADKKSSPEDEERIRKELEALKEATKRKEKKCKTMESSEKKEVKRKNINYKKYIVPRIFLAIQTGFTSELAFWLGRKSTEDGIRKHIEDADD